MPNVSIIIVNYNGRHWLEKCLPTVFASDFPEDKFEVIVVDNYSQDTSVHFIESHYPQIILVKSDQNLGFTGGNNLGLLHAKGDYIVLLNSDTEVDSHWLSNLVKHADENPKCGIVQSKLLLNTKFTTLHISSNVFPKSLFTDSVDHTPIGVLIEDITSNDPAIKNLIWYDHGFFTPIIGEIITRRSTGQSEIILPYKENSPTFNLTLHGLSKKTAEPLSVKVQIGDHIFFKGEISQDEVIQVEIDLSLLPEQDFYYLVQNAGNVLLKNGKSKDRGGILRIMNSKVFEFYEKDQEYFNQPKQLMSVCGASCLIKREVINQIKFLDGYYFMYYEDVEFSIRAWKMGWELDYEPRSIVYHHHMGSTKQGDWNFFHHLIERNHLMLTIVHFSVKVAFITFILFTIKLIFSLFIYWAYHFRNNIHALKDWQTRVELRKTTFLFIVGHLPVLIKNKMYWKNNQIREDLESHLL